MTSLTPLSHSNTLYTEQPLSARVIERGSGLSLGSITFTLRDLTTESSQELPAIRFEREIAQTAPTHLTVGHVYSFAVRATDAAGNIASADQGVKPDYGFLAVDARVSPTTATAVRTDGKVIAAGTATFDHVKVTVGNALVTLSGSQHSGFGYVESQVPLTNLRVCTNSGTATTCQPAFNALTAPELQPRTVAEQFVVTTPSTTPFSGLAVGWTGELGTLRLAIPASWSNVHLVSAPISVRPAFATCAGQLDGGAFVSCGPDPMRFFIHDGMGTDMGQNLAKMFRDQRPASAPCTGACASAQAAAIPGILYYVGAAVPYFDPTTPCPQNGSQIGHPPLPRVPDLSFSCGVTYRNVPFAVSPVDPMTLTTVGLGSCSASQISHPPVPTVSEPLPIGCASSYPQFTHGQYQGLCLQDAGICYSAQGAGADSSSDCNGNGTCGECKCYGEMTSLTVFTYEGSVPNSDPNLTTYAWHLAAGSGALLYSCEYQDCTRGWEKGAVHESHTSWCGTTFYFAPPCLDDGVWVGWTGGSWGYNYEAATSYIHEYPPRYDYNDYGNCLGGDTIDTTASWYEEVGVGITRHNGPDGRSPAIDLTGADAVAMRYPNYTTGGDPQCGPDPNGNPRLTWAWEAGGDWFETGPPDQQCTQAKADGYICHTAMVNGQYEHRWTQTDWHWGGNCGAGGCAISVQPSQTTEGETDSPQTVNYEW